MISYAHRDQVATQGAARPRCSPLPCSCKECATAKPRRALATPQPESYTCAQTSALTRSLGRRNIEVLMSQPQTIQFDRHEAGSRRENGIAYKRGAFCLPEAGWYHFDLNVCFVADKSLGDELGACGSNVSIGMVSLRHEERFVYARIQSSEAGATRPSSNATVSLSGDVHVCAQQILSFVVSFTDPRVSHIKLRAADFNPDHSRPCTFVSIRQICRDGPSCCVAPIDDCHEDCHDDCHDSCHDL